jgi:hypothetical protein
MINAYGKVGGIEVEWGKYIMGENLLQNQILLHKSRSNKKDEG